MNFLITFCIFVIILFLYVHINEQYKKSEDLEIYETDYVSNTNLQTICNLKQPVLFKFDLPESINNLHNKLSKVENTDIKVWDVDDYYQPDIHSVQYIVLPFSSAEKLFKSDPKGHYFTERNQEFLEETDILSEIRELDPYIKPNFTAHSNYEYITGSSGTMTPLRYHTGDRKFIAVLSGKVSVRMTSWRSNKYLDPIRDYDNYEFYSKTNAWSSSPNEMLRYLEFEVHPGYVLVIPPYWWYSYKFTTADTSAISIEYKTMINLCAHSVDLGRYYLQFHNTKKIPARTLAVETSI
jgi:hypothetical protein